MLIILICFPNLSHNPLGIVPTPLWQPRCVHGLRRSAFLAKLDAIQEARGKVSNAAYNVGSFGAYRAVASGKGCKPRRAARMFATMAAFGLDAKLKRLLAQGDSAATFDAICVLPGIGQFIGYQICIDLGYWSQEVYDESKHVFLGPGKCCSCVGVSSTQTITAYCQAVVHFWYLLACSHCLFSLSMALCPPPLPPVQRSCSGFKVVVWCCRYAHANGANPLLGADTAHGVQGDWGSA